MYYFTLSEEEARNICGAFLFREDDIYKKDFFFKWWRKGKGCFYETYA